MTLPPKNFHVLKRVSGSAGVVLCLAVAGVLIREALPVSNKLNMFCVIV
jgi:hypothetical protein